MLTLTRPRVILRGQSCLRERCVFMRHSVALMLHYVNFKRESTPSKHQITLYLQMEPVVGIEPTTDGLQNRCSTTELNWLFYIKNTKYYTFIPTGF